MSRIDPGRDYLALATFFHLKSFLTTFRFLQRARIVTDHLQAGPPGLVGFSLRAKPLSRRYWTLSVWDDGRALMVFVRQQPHVTVMEDLAPKMRAFESVRWTISGSGYPPSWQEAQGRLGERQAAR